MRNTILKHASVGILIFLLNFFSSQNSQAGHAVMIAYPDSKITVDLWSISKMELGHGGILIIGDAGETNYYEFGRYQGKKTGMVRKVTLPKVTFTSDGELNKKSLLTVLENLSKYSGQRGRIRAAYLPGLETDKMLAFVKKSMAKWPDYHWYSNNCGTYAAAVLLSGNPPRKPLFCSVVTKPENLVKDYLYLGAGEINYDPKTRIFCFRDPGAWWQKFFQPGCQPIASLE